MNRELGPSLHRGIYKWELVLLFINSVIGAGIFGLPSKVFALSGVYSLLAAEGKTDLSYRFKKAFWNQGYAPEASAVCLQYGFEKLGLSFIAARILKENKASIKVAEKLGMRFWQETDFYEQPGLYYRVTREEYFSHPPVC